MKVQQWLLNERRRIVTGILGDLEGFACAALLGEHRMGKTSTLDLLEERLQRPLVRLSMARLEACSLHQVEAELYHRLVVGLAPTPRSAEVDAEPGAAQAGFPTFEARLQELAPQPTTILLDDAELLEQHEWGVSFFYRLSVLMRRHRELRVVLAGTRRLEFWAQRMAQGNGRGGPWELLRQPVVLRPVPAQQILDGCGGDDLMARRLIELCGGHPFCLWRLLEDAERHEQPLLVLLESLKQRARSLYREWAEVFGRYWNGFDLLTRQVCYLLATGAGAMSRRRLEARIQTARSNELDRSLQLLDRSGLLSDSGDNDAYRLIELFRDWYRDEIGWSAAPAAAPTQQTIEFSFLAEQDTVLVHRFRYVYSSALGLSAADCREIVERAQGIPAGDRTAFLPNIMAVSQLLWAKVHQTSWFQELMAMADQGHSLRFNVPNSMGEFPFELLPLDKQGSDRIGMKVPISRRVLGQGRAVDRAPLRLQGSDGRRLKVLVVAAQVTGEIHIDEDGRIRPAGSVPHTTSGEVYVLDDVDLNLEVEVLCRTLTSRPDLIDSVTVLCETEVGAMASSIPVRWEPPTAENFRKLLTSHQDTFDVFHFVGHGLVDPEAPMQGGLLFRDGLVHPALLKFLLEKQSNLRLVYLSCCHSAALSRNEWSNDLLGLGHACVNAGVPAVLTMRWAITAGASRRLTANFYPALFRSGNVDEALYEACREVYAVQFDPAKRAFSAASVLVLH